MNKTRPFLKWAGNKYRCLNHILNALPDSDRLIEPFTGSGAIFINSNYSQYLLGEQNQDLITLYNLLKEKGALFIDYCSAFFTGQYNNKTDFYQFREEFNQSNYGERRAALFLYLNRHGYNGLCRYNQSGKYNVPFGQYKKPYFPLKEMSHFHNHCQSAEFLQADFRTTFLQAKPGDVIYCDPPYVPLSDSANFSAYTQKIFTENDQITLANLALESANKGIVVIISNHDTEFTRHHYRLAKMTSFPVKRSISCHAEQRRNVQELLAVFR